jgi:anthranilate 1,2-dioxygenase small subunit
MNNALTLERLDTLQLRYARALDKHDMRSWSSCFAREASYVCITRENVEQNLPVAVMMDDTRARIEDRVKAVDEVWKGTFEDYHTRHFVQRLAYTQIAEDRWSMESDFLVTYTAGPGDTQILAAGVYLDEVVADGGEAKLASRTAIIDANATPRYLVYPI